MGCWLQGGFCGWHSHEQETRRMRTQIRQTSSLISVYQCVFESFVIQARTSVPNTERANVSLHALREN
jgi:hypothetical protein